MRKTMELIISCSEGSLQFVCGFGVPVEELQFETVLTGIVFKSTHILPSTVFALRNHTTHPITEPYKIRTNVSKNFDFFDMKREYKNSNLNYISKYAKYRWLIYKVLEKFSENYGYAGRTCVLRTICEAADAPFHYGSGLLSEILHIILTPSTSADELTTHADNEYYHAEQIGRLGGPCNEIFKECTKSILTQFSQVFHFS
ncbi:uncharacterized protein LOC119676508 [Teleopsis dalmanni]|uniref:uncharacterized protein LOC119676508 n=1 Tax=Teleopsis dalmanni TaxID=139649 RepID=UPI0018CE5522|nr:uncharacterized protein LOC119676508 [Teleopsis dalmanni]